MNRDQQYFLSCNGFIILNSSSKKGKNHIRSSVYNFPLHQIYCRFISGSAHFSSYGITIFQKAAIIFFFIVKRICKCDGILGDKRQRCKILYTFLSICHAISRSLHSNRNFRQYPRQRVENRVLGLILFSVNRFASDSSILARKAR